MHYVIILVLAFVLYGNSIGNRYSLDDNFVTATGPRNPNLKIQKGIAGIPEIFSSRYFESDNQSFEYRPVVLSTYALEYQFFGSNPHVSHFINVAIYGFTCVLLYSIFLNFFSGWSPFFSFTVVLLFLFHPIHTEVVDNLKSRDELLSFFLGLLSMRYFFGASGEAKIKKILLGSLFLALALLSKRSAALFAALIPVTLYFFTSIKIKNILLLIVPMLLAFATYSLLKKGLVGGAQAREYAFFENPLFYHVTVSSRMAMVLFTLGYYLQLLIFPHPLSCYYGYRTIDLADWSMPLVWISLVFHLFIAVYAMLNLKKRSLLSFVIIVYLIGLFPFSNIVYTVVGVVGERFVYFSSLAFCIGAVALVFKAFRLDPISATLNWKHLKAPLRAICILTLLLCSIKVISRNRAWKDELTLFRTDVKSFDNSCNLHYITANSIAREIRETSYPEKRSALIAEAKLHYRRAADLMAEGIEKFPNDYITLNNLGTIYVDVLNEAERAQPLFKRVKALKPTNQEAGYNFAYCYEKRNMTDSAIAEYEKLTTSGNTYLPVYLRMHELYSLKGEYKKAITSDTKALHQDPTRIEFYINLGNSYMLSGDTLKGLQYFEQAAARAPSDRVLLQKISNVFKVIGDTSKAREYAKKAGSI